MSNKKNKDLSVTPGALHLILLVPIISSASLTYEVGIVTAFYRK